VSGAGLASATFSSLANAPTVNALFSQLSSMNLGQVSAQISQSQLNQIVKTFGSDPAFQTFLSTGNLPPASSSQNPSAPGSLPTGASTPGLTPAPVTNATPPVQANPGNVPVTPPVVGGTGLATSTFNTLANAPSVNALFSQLSSMNLGQVSSQISQVQLNQIVKTFGSDPAFQTFLSTGNIPPTVVAPSVTSSSAASTSSSSAPATTPSTLAPSNGTPAGAGTGGNTASSVMPSSIPVPVVSGSGLDSASFSSLANAPTASSLLSQLATQNLGAIASQISQTQLNQLVSKFGSDSNFQTLIATGSIPANAQSSSKALLKSPPADQAQAWVQDLEVHLMGQQLA
jgi:hypothetical protein